MGFCRWSWLTTALYVSPDVNPMAFCWLLVMHDSHTNSSIKLLNRLTEMNV